MPPWGMDWKVAFCALCAFACSSNDGPVIGDDGGSDAFVADTGGADDAGDDASGADATPDAMSTDATMDAPENDAGEDGGSEDAGSEDAGPGGCSPERACSDGFYCVYGGSCGAAGPGTCMPISDFCTEDCPGVCGCDGALYCNACIAGRSGVDVDPDGECRTERGCASSAMCPLSEYCQLESCDGDGLCQTRPDLCPAVIDPVCACNGMTYNNACEANRAGQSVARAGSCFDT